MKILSWNETLAAAVADLAPVAEAHPGLDPEALRVLLQDTVAGLEQLEQIAGEGGPGHWEVLARDKTVARLVVARRRAHGLHVCSQHQLCMLPPRLVERGLVKLWLCEEHDFSDPP